jgi:hypothetical protein
VCERVSEREGVREIRGKSDATVSEDHNNRSRIHLYNEFFVFSLSSVGDVTRRP